LFNGEKPGYKLLDIPIPFQTPCDANSLFFNDSSVQALGVLDVHALHIAVELLLGAFLIVTLAGDANSYSERDASDTGFPDLLVQLRVEAYVFSAL